MWLLAEPMNRSTDNQLSVSSNWRGSWKASVTVLAVWIHRQAASSRCRGIAVHSESSTWDSVGCICILLFFNLMFKHGLEICSCVWVEHLHLWHVFAQWRLPSRSYHLTNIDWRTTEAAFQLASVLLFLTFVSQCLRLVLIRFFLFDGCFLHSICVPRLFQWHVFAPSIFCNLHLSL